MATKRKSSGRSGESGSTLYGALAGLLIGLIVAAVVAFYVTKAPVPFVDRASRDAGKLPDPRQAPDPNAGLYGRDGAAGTPPSGPTATTPAPLPGTGTAGADTPPSKSDDLGALIATLPTSNNKPAAAAVAPTPAAPNPLPTPIAKVAPTPARRPRLARRRHRRPPRHRQRLLLSAGRRLPQRRRRRIAQGPHHPAGPAGVGAEGRSQRQGAEPRPRGAVCPPGRHEPGARAPGREQDRNRGGAAVNGRIELIRPWACL